MAAAPLLAAVRQAAVMVDDETKRVAFRFAKHKLTLEAQGVDDRPVEGRAAGGLRGQGDGHRLQPEYLIEMLKVVPPDAELTLDLIDADTPVLFHCGADYSYLVVPIGAEGGVRAPSANGRREPAGVAERLE